MNVHVALDFVKRKYPPTVTIEPWEVYADHIVFRIKYAEGTTIIHTVDESDLTLKNI